MPSPIRVWPVLQEYVATELYVVVETDTIPFAGLLTAPQSTSADTRKMKSTLKVHNPHIIILLICIIIYLWYN